MTISESQLRILRTISRLLREGERPSLAVIASEVGLKGPSSLDRTVKILQCKKLIVMHTTGYGKLRRYSVTEAGRQLLAEERPIVAPYLGEVPAGFGTETSAACGEEMSPEEALGYRAGDYFLRVVGESMVDAGIDDGSLVLIRPAKEANRDEIAVLLIKEENQVTLKYLHRAGRFVSLVPANKGMRPQKYKADLIEVQGVVKAVIKQP